jgi:hypothetical protein
MAYQMGSAWKDGRAILIFGYLVEMPDKKSVSGQQPSWYRSVWVPEARDSDTGEIAPPYWEPDNDLMGGYWIIKPRAWMPLPEDPRRIKLLPQPNDEALEYAINSLKLLVARKSFFPPSHTQRSRA